MIWTSDSRRDSAAFGAIGVDVPKSPDRRREAAHPRFAPIPALAGLIRARGETRHGRAPTPAPFICTQTRVIGRAFRTPGAGARRRGNRQRVRTRGALARWPTRSRPAEVVARA